MFVAADLIPCNKTKNVLVFIPPPVEPGDAPINISIITTRSPADEKLPSGYVEKPAVLVEKLRKKAPSHEIFSVALMRSVPETIRNRLIEITTRECIERFFQ